MFEIVFIIIALVIIVPVLVLAADFTISLIRAAFDFTVWERYSARVDRMIDTILP